MTRRSPALLVLALAVLVVAPALLVLALAVLAPAAAWHNNPRHDSRAPSRCPAASPAARNVRGEHVGEIVQRTWTFTPLCAAGPCAQVRLVRGRGNGTDSLILDRTTPGHYAGTGRFFAPLKCAGTVYATGEEVPFEIKLHVTATATAPTGRRWRAQITRHLRQQDHAST